MQTQLTVTEEINESLVGKTLDVLCEGFDTVAEIHFGRSFADAPDVDAKVYFSSPRRIPEGAFCEVEITEAVDYDLIGVLCDESVT